MALRRAVIGCLLACFGAACSSKKPPPAPAPAASASATGPAAGAPAPGAPVPPPAPDPEASAELIVGSKRGLEAWRRDGSGKRMISAGVALHPRFIDGANVLVVKPSGRDENLVKGGQLWRIALADGKRSKVATLPAFACAQDDTPLPPADDDPEDGSGPLTVAAPSGPAVDHLSIQDEGDFTIEAGGRAARIALLDRNVNMATVTVDVRVDLKTGKVERWLSHGEHQCSPPKGVTIGEPPEAPGAVAPEGPTQALISSFRFRFEAGQLFEGNKTNTVALVPGYEAEALSPSARWRVLGGDVSEGDYIHRKLVLLDRATGALFPIAAAGGAWPAAIKRPDSVPGRPAPTLKTPIDKTVEVVGETELRWLGATAASERLVVGDLIVRPGGSGFKVAGQIAR